MPRVLHLLSQRPLRTGSGVTLDALVRHADEAGWTQAVVVGTPAEDARPAVASLPSSAIRPLVFGEGGDVGFALPGMSDVMPYSSSRFSALSAEQIESYCTTWRRHLEHTIACFRPNVIHVHHVWLLASTVRDVAPGLPVVVHCHATGLRQMSLCPHLAPRVQRGCARLDRFLVLHEGHAEALVDALRVPRTRIDVVGAGYREDLFSYAPGSRSGERLLYIGKYSQAKGLPELLDAVEILRADRPQLVLDVAGSGAGEEAQALRARMEALAPTVVLHGQLGQAELADLMRRAAVTVLPSLYEGLPLVLVEALACGSRLVATALPGIVETLAPHLGDAIELVEGPALRAVDVPEPSALPAFVERLVAALDRALEAPPLGDPRIERPNALRPFRWRAVFERVECSWRRALAARGGETGGYQ